MRTLAGKNKVVASITESESEDEEARIHLEGIVVETDRPEPVSAGHSEET